MSQDEYAQEFDAMFADMARRSRSNRLVPNADVFLNEAGTALLVRIELAGADPSRLLVEADERMLYISGTRSQEPSPFAGSCLLKEIEYGAFERKIRLPFAIDCTMTTATYADGFLTIELPAITEEIPQLVRTEIRLLLRKKHA